MDALEVEATPFSVPATTRTITMEDVLRVWLAGRNASTILAYRRDLILWQNYLGAETLERALHVLLTGGAGVAILRVMEFRAKLREKKRSPAAVNRTMSALRSVTKLARMLGLINWTLEIENSHVVHYKDTSGPGLDGYVAMLKVTTDLRNRTILRLLFDVGLRRGEVHRLNLSDFDEGNETRPPSLSILGKGREEKERVTLPTITAGTVAAYVNQERGRTPGPLILNRDCQSGHNAETEGVEARRLSAQTIYEIVRDAGQRANLDRPTRPHGLRHAAITTALDVTNGDVRAVQRFSRHAQIQTLMIYDDNKKDFGGSVASLVAPIV